MRKHNMLPVLVGFFTGYIFQFILHGFNNIWYFFPLKFLSIIGAISGYVRWSMKEDSGTRYKVRLIMVLIAVPLALIYAYFAKTYSIPWIWGI